MELFAKKSLGQHFLASPAALRDIIAAARINPDDRVLEIGPGTGILTEALLSAGARVVAVDKDQRASGVLAEKFAGEIASGRAIFIEGDILSAETLAKIARAGITEGEYALVANIPYYITGAILEQFLERGPRPDRMVLLVQKEVAERIVARDGKESILSISVKSFGEPRIVAAVPRGAFIPPPRVDSAIISIEGIAARSSIFARKNLDIQRFFRIVRAGFAHKRKYALRNLEAAAPADLSLDSLADAWKSLGLDPKIRPETISATIWLDIAACTRAQSDRSSS